MEVRTCKECGEYRYIQSEGLCRDCCEDDEGEYCVVAYYGLMPAVQAKGLTKEEAKELIEDKPAYFTVRKCE